MIIVGNQRGGAADLAQHLMKADNEHVQVHELRGFVAQDLQGAFRESYAVSRSTKCKQHLFSVSFNPPKNQTLDIAGFERAIAQTEERLGLNGQPRAIVFHEKLGRDGELRRHAHAVWCRVFVDEGKAVHLPHSKRKLNDLSRELYHEHGWQLPRGYQRHQSRDPANYSLAEWQQSKRAKRDPKQMKEMFQDAWAMSDSSKSFAAALNEHGLILARGDRRGFVAMDHKGEAFAITRYCGIKAKETRARLGDGKDLPSASEAHREAAERVRLRLTEVFAAEKQAARQRLQDIEGEEQRLAIDAAIANRRLEEAQRQRSNAETRERQGRIRRGFFGLIDRITGRRKKIEAQNQIEEQQAQLRDIRERVQLKRRQEQGRRAIAQKRLEQLAADKEKLRALKNDVRQIKPKAVALPANDRAPPPKRRAFDGERSAPEPKQPESSLQQQFDENRQQDKEAKREAFKAKRRATSERPRRRSRSRSGPELDR